METRSVSEWMVFVRENGNKSLAYASGYQSQFDVLGTKKWIEKK